jgi:ribonuclease HI
MLYNHSMNKDIIIFTDGSSSGNPGPGGWGVIIAMPDATVKELGGKEAHTTNNKMELRAAIEALHYLRNHKGNSVIHTDSSYVINGITKWAEGWSKNNWITSTKTAVINKDLWQDLMKLVKQRESHSTTTWKYVAGHSGIPGNERVDEIATAFTFDKDISLYSGDLDAYPTDLSKLNPVGAIKDAKDSKRARASGKAFSYLSMINGDIQIHRTWAECEARVKGKSGTKYKKALSREEQEEIIKSWKSK